MNTDFNLNNPINFIHEKALTIAYLPGEIDFESLETAVKIIHDTFTEVPKNNIRQLNEDLKILEPYVKSSSCQAIFKKCLKLTNTIAPEEVINHPGYFGNKISEGKQFFENITGEKINNQTFPG